MSKSMRGLLASLAVLLATGAAIPFSEAVAVRARAPARAALAQQCGDPFSGHRDPANPLALPHVPGANPLRGAHFFVDGPAHGAAASVIAAMLGIGPHRLPDRESWAQFVRALSHGALHRRILANHGLAFRVHELEKIAAQPEVQRLSAYSEGGGPGAIFKQTEKLLCHNFTADRDTIPLLNTYFLHPAAGSCPSPSALDAAGPTFRRRVDELAAAVGRRPAVFLLETDGVGTTRCIARAGSLPLWEADLRYEVGAIAALPHSVVYLEGGYSDSNSARFTARMLNAAGIGRIRGFYTNDTHQQWTITEVRWANRISRLTHGAHYIVNTAQNGRGPLLNRHPARQGVEDLCNPPGRGAGARDTTQTGFRYADAWMWTSPPGNSSGCGGGPSGGTFWPARAIGLAARANGKLGPGFPSRPY
jgi:endoglucanase